MEALRAALRAEPRRSIAALRDGTVPPRAAVLLALVRMGGEHGLVFTLRAATLERHAREVSFPGGKMEAADGGRAEQTALREAEEELGVPLAWAGGGGGVGGRADAISAELLGLHHDALSTSGLAVTPVIALLDADDAGLRARLRPNPAEVEDVFLLPLAALRDPARRTQREWPPHVTARGRTTVFTAGPYPVWGLTAHFVEQLLRLPAD